MSDTSLTPSEAMALQTFELANGVREEPDAIYKYDAEDQKRQVDAEPWKTNPKPYTKVKMSSLAMLKMVMHARAGGEIEVMGLMQGKVDGDTMIVMDAYALPVEGTETRVNAQAAAYGYMFEYLQLISRVGRAENVVGWYHSHPGYGCWLSGIDVGTQKLHQKGNDPFLAVVVDPVRTAAAGKVELGAFRTYPDGYTPPDAGPQLYQSIPRDKIEDFGVHANSYYELPVEYFKSSLDAHLLGLVWRRFWASTLAASPLLANTAFTAKRVSDLNEKLSEALSGSVFSSGTEAAVAKCCSDGCKLSADVLQGLMAHMVKHQVFNGERS